MVELANAITIDDIPPMVQLTVLNETYGVIDGKREQWYTTPVSISRIFRGPEYTKSIELSAESSFDLNDRPLTFHWTVLRGDPSHVRIVALNAASSRVRIEFDYHPRAVIEGSERLSNMVEVGVFVHNGAYYSAPGFVTSYTLDNQTRSYGTDGTLLESVENSNYVHPTLQ
jgi:hypothetical protein